MADALRKRMEDWGVHDVLVEQPGLRLRPVTGQVIRLVGELTFSASAPARERIDESYAVEITVPCNFPKELPTVRETAGRIPKTYHRHPNGALCLGSPTRQLLAILAAPTISGYLKGCLIPFLYGFSLYSKYGTAPPFGELAHGRDGIWQDFAALFGVESQEAACECVRLASLRKRSANKEPCPCGSRRRVGNCHHQRINKFRSALGRPWFRQQYAWLQSLK
jgi:hypothetical protein